MLFLSLGCLPCLDGILHPYIRLCQYVSVRILEGAEEDVFGDGSGRLRLDLESQIDKFADLDGEVVIVLKLNSDIVTELLPGLEMEPIVRLDGLNAAIITKGDPDVWTEDDQSIQPKSIFEKDSRAFSDDQAVDSAVVFAGECSIIW